MFHLKFYPDGRCWLTGPTGRMGIGIAEIFMAQTAWVYIVLSSCLTPGLVETE